MAVSGISGMTRIWLEDRVGDSLQADGKALASTKSIETAWEVKGTTRSQCVQGVRQGIRGRFNGLLGMLMRHYRVQTNQQVGINFTKLMWPNLRKRCLPRRECCPPIEFSQKGKNGHLDRDCGENSCSRQGAALTMKIYCVCLALNKLDSESDSASYQLGDPGLQFCHV